MLMTTATLTLPNVLLTTVGIVEKKAPLAAPLITTKTINGPNVVDAGQTANMVMAVMANDTSSVLSEPSLSQAMPDPIRPNADARLKPATRLAPTFDEKPRDLVYIGMKNGATYRGNVPRALPTRTRSKFSDLKRRLLWSISSAEACPEGESNLPFNDFPPCYGCAVLHQPGSRQPGG